jgi:hypothetical protein
MSTKEKQITRNASAYNVFKGAIDFRQAKNENLEPNQVKF